MTIYCIVCEQNVDDFKQHNCPMKGKMDDKENLIVKALFAAELCDHTHCGLSPRSCKAKVVASYLRRRK